jgi:hypothetical protein
MPGVNTATVLPIDADNGTLINSLIKQANVIIDPVTSIAQPFVDDPSSGLTSSEKKYTVSTSGGSVSQTQINNAAMLKAGILPIPTQIPLPVTAPVVKAPDIVTAKPVIKPAVVIAPVSTSIKKSL